MSIRANYVHLTKIHVDLHSYEHAQERYTILPLASEFKC